MYKHLKQDIRLKEVCRDFLPEYVAPNPTKQRKFWQTTCFHEDREMADKLADLKKTINNLLDHGDGCGYDNYTSGKAIKVAQDSKLVSQAFFGVDLIPFPQRSDAVLKANVIAKKEKWANAAALKKSKAASASAENAGEVAVQVAEEAERQAEDEADRNVADSVLDDEEASDEALRKYK